MERNSERDGLTVKYVLDADRRTELDVGVWWLAVCISSSISQFREMYLGRRGSRVFMPVIVVIWAGGFGGWGNNGMPKRKAHRGPCDANMRRQIDRG